MKNILLGIIFLFLTGCSHTEIWEKPGGNQHKFDIDSRECEIIAEKFGILQSEKGKIPDPTSYSRAYRQCIEAKGWRMKTADPEITQDNIKESTPQLASITAPNMVVGFGQTISMPETFELSMKNQFENGPTIIKQFFWKGTDSYINILFQENIATNFEVVPYPVLKPYNLYTSGKGEKSRENLQWASFWAKIGSDWIMGTGAYFHVNNKQRIIIVITKSLEQPVGTSPKNIILTKNQFMQIDKFSEEWQIWLNQQFTKGPNFMKQLKETLNFGKQETLSDM